jgi:hypothetical protein
MGGPLNKSIAQTGKKLNADGSWWDISTASPAGWVPDLGGLPASVALDVAMVRAATAH